MRQDYSDFAQWTTKGRIGGLDPLAMLAPIEACYGRLLPGISSVTVKFRYYAFFSWWIDEYTHGGMSTSSHEFEEHLRRGEALLALVSAYAHDEISAEFSTSGVAGTEWASRMIEHSEGPIDFCEASSIDTPKGEKKRYLDVHVFRAAYGSQMSAIGLLSRLHGFDVFAPTDLGKKMAAVYRDANSKENLNLFRQIAKSGTTTKEELGLLVLMRAGNLKKDSVEENLLRDLLFGRCEVESKIRADTLIEILIAARDMNKFPSQDDLRWLWFDNSPGDNHPRRDCRLAWQYYQVGDSLRVCLEALLYKIAHILSNSDGDQRPQDLTYEVCKDVPANVSFEDFFLSLEVASDGVDTELLHRRAVTSVSSMSDILSLLARVYVRWSDRAKDLALVYPETERFITPISGLGFLKSRKDESAQKVLRTFILEKVIRQHLWVATRKLHGQGNFTYVFEFEEGKLSVRSKGSTYSSGPRTATALRFLEEIGLIDKEGITANGAEELENAV